MRDIRDPQAIGEAIAAERSRNPKSQVCKVADFVLQGSIVRNYGESRTAYLQRVNDRLGSNGQLAPTR